MRWAALVLVTVLAMGALLAACATGSRSEDAAVPVTTPPPSTASTSTTGPSTTTTIAPPTTVAPSTTVAITTTTGLTQPECSVVQVDAGGGVVLTAERCAPAGATGPVPAALVLNGCGGYLADAGITSLIARRLAALGVLSLRLDYLGVAPAPPSTYCDPAKVAAVAPKVVSALSGALATLRADPAVDPARIGAVGYSLGGLATALVQLGGGGFAAIPSAGFGAIGLLSPVVHGQLTDLAAQGKVPPLALVVGSADFVVGTAGTTALASAAQAGGVDVVLDVVDGNGHEWTGQAAEAAADTLASFVASRLAAIRPGERS